MKINKKWTIKEQSFLLEKLSMLLTDGYTLNEALTIVQYTMPSIRKADLYFCVEMLKKGVSIRVVLTELKFNKDVLSYLYFSEKHGDLTFALREASKLLSQKLIQREKMLKVLRYPVFLIIFVGVILFLVQTIIAPQFLDMYTNMNIEPSLFTIILFLMFDFVKIFILLIVICIFCGFIYYLFFFRKNNAEQKMSILVKIPVIGQSVKLMNSYYFSLQLSNLLRAGLSSFESLKIFAEQSILPFYQIQAVHFIQQLKEGERFPNLFNHSPFYDRDLVNVMTHGEANGHLDRELYTYSQFILARMENKLSLLFSIIQPLVYLTVGLIILFVYLSIMLPMYQMIDYV